MTRHLATPLVALVALAALTGCSSGHPSATFRRNTEPFTSRAWDCWPLPAATAPDFPVLVRKRVIHGSGDRRRQQVTLQFFNVTPAEAERRLEGSIASGGFRIQPGGTDELRFDRSGFGTGTVTVQPIPGAGPDIPVRGQLIFDLPRRKANLQVPKACPVHGRPVGGGA